MNETHHYYQYAFAKSDCPAVDLGAGVDPRFPIELIPEGPVVAVASRVGLDRFDPGRLRRHAPEDFAWLQETAIRHSEALRRAFQAFPILPLQFGTLFPTQESLRLASRRFHVAVVDFLDWLGNRQEWDIKLFIRAHTNSDRGPADGKTASWRPSPNRHRATSTIVNKTSSGVEMRDEDDAVAPAASVEQRHASPVEAEWAFASWAAESAGIATAAVAASPASPSVEYSLQKVAKLEKHRRRQADIQSAIDELEQRLQPPADEHCRVRAASNQSAGRPEELVFHAAFLLNPAAVMGWLETAEELREAFGCNGLSLEWSGPWPPYHFCPELELGIAR